MRWFIFVILLLLLSIKSYSQSEFINQDGGFSFFYGQANPKEDPLSKSLGMSLQLKSGLFFGLASQKVLDENKPQLFAGFITKEKSERNYARTFAGVNYLKTKDVTSVTGSVGLAYLINGNRFSPTSISGSVSIQSITLDYDDGRIGSGISPLATLAASQAIAANETFSPYLGFGIGYDLQNSQSQVLFQIGFNINFKQITNSSL